MIELDPKTKKLILELFHPYAMELGFNERDWQIFLGFIAQVIQSYLDNHEDKDSSYHS